MNKGDIEISKRLKGIRESLNINQDKFSEILEIRQSYYSEIETGKRPVSAKVINKLREEYDISSDWMYSGKGDIYITKSDNGNSTSNVSLMSSLPKQEARRFSPYNFYKGLSDKDLDFEISIELEELKDTYETYKNLIEFLHAINPPDWLKGKFPMLPDFKIWLQDTDNDFTEDHSHLKDEKRLKVLKIVDLYQMERDHLHRMISKTASYLNQYSDMILLNNVRLLKAGETVYKKGK